MNKNDKKQHRSNKGIVNQNAIRDYTVYKDTTLLEFLFFKMPDTPKKNVKSLLSHHQVAVGGVPVSQFDYPLTKEDVVTVSKFRIAKKSRKDLPILYEDEDIIALDKPSGLLSVATEKEKGKTAYRLVSDYVAAKNRKSRVYVVHRLDEDTSGVLVFAKSQEVREALQKSWQEIVKKRGDYAIVEGEMEKQEDTLKDYLEQDNFQLVRVSKNKAKGKLAITHFKVIETKGPYSLLNVDIASGRKNQIRVQLGHIGHFVIGDDKYGNPSDPLKRLGLHAYELSFTNPLNGKEYDIKSPMPKEFKSLFFVSREQLRQMQSKASQKKPRDVMDSRSAIRIKKGKERRKNFRYGR
ncbi:MAG TPA: RluA family pseudouridine synthase [Firmicutes bacterium]|nr:RluA family pseudouridine synthase [Bacillota bacterium]